MLIVRPVVYLLCGLTGSGKTTYAGRLEAEGCVRLSIDEAVHARHGRYDIDYPASEYTRYYEQAVAELDRRLVELLEAGRSLVFDHGLWRRSDRDRYKALVEAHGGHWELLYFKAEPSLLRERLAQRNIEGGANALRVSDDMLEDFIARFEEPRGEGERIVGGADAIPELAREIRAYYERGTEADRLTGGFPSGPLELARTKEILLRFLPPAPLDVLDVGGGAGAHAAWLTERGHRVQLIDPVPLHVEQARAGLPNITAELGDARALVQADRSVDVALLLGPLYHLIEREERLLALSEARRVLRPGGLVFAAAISRFAALFDLLVRLDRLHEPKVMELVSAAVEDGAFHGASNDLFTTAYFHLPHELAEELTEAGFADPRVLNIEGPGFLISDLPERWSDEPRREAILAAARLIEAEPATLGASGHLLGVASA